MAFATPRRARHLWDYWRSEQRTLRQGFVALMLGTGAAFVAGITLGSITETLTALPGLLLLTPAAIAQRGVIFGAMAARLGTSTHAGLFEVTRNRQGVLYQNAFAGVVATLSLTLYLAGLARLFALAFGLPSMSFLSFVTVSVVGGVIASTVILLLTVALSVVSYRRGYDLDAVAIPVITATSDMVTVPALFVATLLTGVGWLNTAVASVCIAVAIGAAIRGLVTDLPLARRVIVESLPLWLATPVLSILAGTFLETRLDAVFRSLPGLLVLVPPFIANAGSLGGILSSRLTSKLHLGVITPRGRPETPALLDGSLVIGFAVIAFTILGILGWGFSALAGTAHPGASVMIGATLVAGLLATGIAILLAYYVAILSLRVGLDPDNHVVPIITSVMDLVGVVSFLMVLAVFGVSGHG